MKKLTFILICLLLAIPCQARTITVDDDSPADFNTIQAAINDSNDGDIIEVQPGVYTGLGNRDIDFKGKAITVRSEDGPNDCIIDCNATWTDCHRGFHFHSNEDADSILEGFTITNGYMYDFLSGVGGAILCEQASPTIINCIITGNSAESAGGINCRWYSSPTITDCTIMNNSGGGIYCGWHSSPTITNCTIMNNSGGGISCGYSSPTITNCTITDNSARDSGGGIYCWDSNPTIANCTITGNTAGEGVVGWFDGGGGIWCLGSSLCITNCTIAGNSAEYGGAIRYLNWDDDSKPTIITNSTFAENYAADGTALACDSYSPAPSPGNLQLTNCILWDDGDEIWNNDNSTITITYSNIQGGYAGTGNIDTDPCFVEPGYWADANDPNIIVEPNDPNAVWIEGDYHLYPFSLCINTGDPNYIPEPNETDLDGNPRIIDGRIDMGAYESNHIHTRLWILPRTINRQSRQRRIMAWLRLPQGITKDQIDSNVPLLLYPGQIEPTRQFIFQRGRRHHKRTSIIAFFDKSDLMAAVPNGPVELWAVGQLKTGRYFHGSDTIRIISRPRRPRPWPRRPKP